MSIVPLINDEVLMRLSRAQHKDSKMYDPNSKYCILNIIDRRPFKIIIPSHRLYI